MRKAFNFFSKYIWNHKYNILMDSEIVINF